MAAFQSSSQWLKLALLEVHLALFLFMFPIAAVGGMPIGPASLITVTGLLLLLSCILTYTWVFVKEIYNNRLLHLGVLVINFLIGVFCVVSVIVLFQQRDYSRMDNVIEAAIGTAILSIVAGIFVLTEMKAFRLPRLPRKRIKNVKVDPAKGDDQLKEAEETKEVAIVASPNTSTEGSGEKIINGPFFKRSMWLKYALYLFCLSIFFNFLPTEPYMSGGTREVTTLVYFSSILSITFLFCWVFLGSISKNRGLHILAAVFIFLTGFFSFVLMVIWLITWSMFHPFTPVLIFCAGLLACLSGGATVLEIRQHKLKTQTRYLDRECTATCFNGCIRLFRIPGVNVVVEPEKDAPVNGDLGERYGTAPTIETTPDTPVKLKDSPKIEPQQESIMNVDHGDTQYTSNKTGQNPGRERAYMQGIATEPSNEPPSKPTAEPSFEPVPDGYNSPRQKPVTPAAPPLSSITFDSKEQPDAPGHSLKDLWESDEFASSFPDEKVLTIPETFPDQLPQSNTKEPERQNNDVMKKNSRTETLTENNGVMKKNSRNETLTGLATKNDLPPVSGMGNEPQKKGYNPFEDDD